MSKLALVIKYKENKEHDFIKSHKNIIDKEGCCWFGKIGKNKSPFAIRHISMYLPAEILFYSKENVYRGTFEKVSYEKPKNCFPNYYRQLWEEDEDVMSVYFLISSLRKIKHEDLNSYVVESNNNNLFNSLKSCSQTCILAQKL